MKKFIMFFLISVISVLSLNELYEVYINNMAFYAAAKEAVEECKQAAPEGAHCKIIAIYESRLPKSKYEDF